MRTSESHGHWQEYEPNIARHGIDSRSHDLGPAGICLPGKRCSHFSDMAGWPDFGGQAALTRH
jgi:hypothetical protein